MADVYPGTDPRGLELLSRMLEFNPCKRISAAEAIMNDYFDDIRLPEQEELAPPIFDLSIDNIESENMSAEQLRPQVCQLIE